MKPGRLVGGRFRVDRLAGSGGMARVYRALDEQSDDAPVALKVLQIPGEAAAQRFVREAELLLHMGAPGIVRSVAHGRTDDGRHWLAMEWLEGEDLQHHLARLPRGQRLSVADAVRVVGRMAEALAPAHSRSVVHRDIKPGNTWLVDGDLGRVKLLDFGMARVWHDRSAVTSVGAVLGTPWYMAPEQARGGDVDARTDVYALGAVLFEVLTGRTPFVGEQFLAVLTKVIVEVAPRASDFRPGLPAALDGLVASMLAKDPADRPADGAAVARALARIPTDTVAGRDGPDRLGGAERRAVCVVIGRPAQLGVEDTLPTSISDTRTLRLREAARQAGLACESLPNGTVIAWSRGDGLPTEDAARAAAAAMILAELAPDMEVALAAGLAVTSDAMPVGGAVDEAVALLQRGQADPGRVRVDRHAAGLLAGRFEVVGAQDGLRLGGRLRVGDDSRFMGQVTPFVGREQEVEELVASLTKALAGRESKLLVLEGEAGAGKSRLRSEVVRACCRANPGLTVITARGEAGGAGSPFALAGSAVRGAAGVAMADPPEIARAKVAARLVAVAPERVEELEAFLGEVAGIPFESAAASPELVAARADERLMRDRLQAAWLEWIAAEAARAPTLLVVEDLHWGDPPSARLLQAAARDSDAPLAVLVLTRPAADHGVIEPINQSGARWIHLGPLPEQACRQLAVAMLGGEGSGHAAVAGSGGNALLLEELLRAEATGSSQATSTLLGALQMRMAAVGDEARRVLRAASVLGGPFAAAALATLTARPGSDVARDLDRLVEAELLAEAAGADAEGRRRFGFRHDLVRTAVYTTLTEEDRETGHRLAARWLEASGRVDPLTLARHWERGGRPDKAAAGYARTAGRALEGDDHAAVVTYADKAVECGAAGVLRGRIERLKAEGLRRLGQYAAAAEAGRQALSLLEETDPWWFKSMGVMVAAHSNLGRFEEVERWPLKASKMQLPPDSPGEAARRVAVGQAAAHALQAGRAEVARELLTALEGSPWDEGLGPDPSMSWRHMIQGQFHLRAGDYVAYLGTQRACIAAFEVAGDERNTCNQQNNLGFGFNQLGGWQQAVAIFRRAIDSADRMDLPLTAAYCWANMAYALMQMGEIDDAEGALGNAMAIAEQTHNVRVLGSSRAHLADLRLRQARPSDALALAEEAAAELQPSPPMLGLAYAVLSRARLANGDVPGAIAAAEGGMEIFESQGGLEEGEPMLRLAHAAALHAAGRRAEAAQVVAEARQIIEEQAARIGDPRWRKTFLEEIEEHAHTLALAATLDA